MMDVKNILKPVYQSLIDSSINNYIKHYSEMKELKLNKNKKKIILFSTPNHGNLGDHLIAKAQLCFLNEIKCDREIIEVTGSCFLKYKEKIKEYISNEDKIFISGGGFLGSLWPNEEYIVRDIFSDYPNNEITILPQTVFYSNKSQQFLEDSMNIYKKHKNVRNIFVRDLQSFEFVNKEMKGCFTSAYFVPDMALFLENEMTNKLENEKVLLCMRSDKEKTISNNFEKELLLEIRANGLSYSFTDTVINKTVSIKRRNTELEKKIKEFSNSRLVITDRLHGMIICAITGTPCIALDNSSKKVSGVYKWISNLDYIHQYSELSQVNNEIINSVKQLSNVETTKYVVPNEFIEMKKVISEIVK